jgi:hypothetical protein
MIVLKVEFYLFLAALQEAATVEAATETTSRVVRNQAEAHRDLNDGV